MVQRQNCPPRDKKSLDCKTVYEASSLGMPECGADRFIYQHRQAEQYHRAQTNLAMQHLSYFQALHAQQQQQQQQKQQQSQQQQQQQQSQQDTKAAQGHSSATSAADTSEDSDTQMSPTAKDSAGLRNRR
ncbi:unnamed protein product [Gongylonema pulchrum]|uniref:Uncharacterized protein n=1 Tax=Gongylonema pulchrum TaxID=637853 RepID=A0A183ESK5_9BILA|nr:unnamed protein product [Gongylonema pulchrum]